MGPVSSLLSLVIAVATPVVASDDLVVRVERVELVMGTLARVQAWGPDSVTCKRAIDRGFGALHRVDDLMSTYRTNSDVSRLNAEGSRGWVSVDTHTFAVVERAVRVAKATGGAFDPTVLPLMYLWGFRGGVTCIPTAGAIDSVLSGVGYQLISFDSAGSRLRLASPVTGVDLGGIAKGYSLGLSREAMLGEGAVAGTVDLGGNLMVFGEEAQGPVALQDPTRQEGVLGPLHVRDASVATSGGYERFVRIGGRRYGHILDPRSGQPVDAVASVTVVGPDEALVDAAATAAFVMGVEDGLAFITATEGIEGCFVLLDDEGRPYIKMTEGFGELWMAGIDQ